MLFQAVVIFLPILNFLKISCKRGKVHWKSMKFCGNRTDNDVLNRKIILIQLFANECSKFKFNAIYHIIIILKCPNIAQP